MFYCRVNLHQLRFVMDYIQNFLPGEIITPVKAVIDLAHEFQIFWGIHCPAVVAEVADVIQESNSKTAWRDTRLKLTVDGGQFYAFVEIWHDMFTMEGFGRFRPCFFQDGKRAHLHVQPYGIGSIKWRRKTITDKVCGKDKFIGEQGMLHAIKRIGHPVKASPDGIDSVIDQSGVKERA